MLFFVPHWPFCTGPMNSVPSVSMYLSPIFIWNLWGFNIGHFLLLLGFKYGCACCWSQLKIYYCVRCQASWTQGSILLCRQIRAPALLGWRWIRFLYKNAELRSAIELIAAAWDALLLPVVFHPLLLPLPHSCAFSDFPILYLSSSVIYKGHF